MPSAGPYEFLIQRYDQGEADGKRLQMRRPELVTRRVCRTCNNGWMNRLVLQSLVLPAAEPLGTHPFSEHAIELWPPTYRTISWPHPRSLDAPGVVRFAEAIAGEPMILEPPPLRVPVRGAG